MPTTILGEVMRTQGLLGQATPTVPDITDEVVLRKQYERKRRLAALQGRTGTFLTGPRGLGGPSSEIASAFLRAALEPPQPWPTVPRTAGGPTRPAPPPGYQDVWEQPVSGI